MEEGGEGEGHLISDAGLNLIRCGLCANPSFIWPISSDQPIKHRLAEQINKWGYALMTLFNRQHLKLNTRARGHEMEIV